MFVVVYGQTTSLGIGLNESYSNNFNLLGLNSPMLASFVKESLKT